MQEELLVCLWGILLAPQSYPTTLRQPLAPLQSVLTVFFSAPACHMLCCHLCACPAGQLRACAGCLLLLAGSSHAGEGLPAAARVCRCHGLADAAAAAPVERCDDCAGLGRV